jgi:hypothetical protein
VFYKKQKNEDAIKNFDFVYRKQNSMRKMKTVICIIKNIKKTRNRRNAIFALLKLNPNIRSPLVHHRLHS